jgi:hypothetical protein
MFTYKATNTNNGKFYVGSSLDFKRRQKEHLRSKRNTPFHNALRKDPNSFEWEVFEDDDHEPTLEQALLDMWFGKSQCYNLCPFAGRPQCNRESSRQWGLKNGPEAGRRTFENEVGIFDPSAPKLEWVKKGGQTCAEKHGKPVIITHPNGVEEVFPTIKAAVRSGLIPYASLQRCLRDPLRKLRSGFTVRHI